MTSTETVTETAPDRLLQRSMRQLATQAQRLGETFLRELHALAPDCRALFTGPTQAHGETLLGAFRTLLDARSDADRFDQLCAELARLHRGYGVSEEHYDDAGAALLRTLRELLGPQFDEDTESAWASLYGRLAESMLAADAEVRSLQHPAANGTPSSNPGTHKSNTAEADLSNATVAISPAIPSANAGVPQSFTNRNIL